MDGAVRPNIPAPAFARGFDPSNQFSVLQLAQAASSQYVDLMDDLFHDADVSDSTTSHRSPGLSRKSPGTRVVRGREPPATLILDFLFLGNVIDAKNTTFLLEHNIKTIVNVSTEQYWLEDNTVQVHSFAALDTSSFEIRPLFPLTSAIIEQVRQRHYGEKDPAKRERILVHCQKGRSRSATIVLAYLIHSNGWTVHEALSYVVQRRECVEPNIGFIEALREYQDSFTDDERLLPLARLSLQMRGVDPTVTVASIAEFFEAKFGPVMDVRQSSPKAAAPTSPVDAGSAHRGKDGSSNGLSEGERAGGAASASASASASAKLPSDDGRPGSSKHAKAASSGSRSVILVFFAGTESVDAAHAAFMRSKKVFAPLATDLSKLRIAPAKGAPRVRRALQRIAEGSPAGPDSPVDVAE